MGLAVCNRWGSITCWWGMTGLALMLRVALPSADRVPRVCRPIPTWLTAAWVAPCSRLGIAASRCFCHRCTVICILCLRGWWGGIAWLPGILRRVYILLRCICILWSGALPGWGPLPHRGMLLLGRVVALSVR